MIDFACKSFDLDEIIKCGFGLTKAEHSLLNAALKLGDEYFTTEELSAKTKLNLSTVQRAVKKMYEQKILERKQNNLDQGGYVYIYKVIDRQQLRKILIDIIRKWERRVEAEVSNW